MPSDTEHPQGSGEPLKPDDAHKEPPADTRTGSPGEGAGSSGEKDASRRHFLRWVTAGGALTWIGLAGIPAIRALISPATRSIQVKGFWVKLGQLVSFNQDEPTQINFAEPERDAWIESTELKDAWIYTEDDKSFRVYNGRCTHLGCRYGYDADNGVFHCPCHGGIYEVKTGKVLAGPPPRPLDTLETRIENGVLSADYMDFRVGVPDKIPV